MEHGYVNSITLHNKNSFIFNLEHNELIRTEPLVIKVSSKLRNSRSALQFYLPEHGNISGTLTLDTPHHEETDLLFYMSLSYEKIVRMTRSKVYWGKQENDGSSPINIPLVELTD